MGKYIVLIIIVIVVLFVIFLIKFNSIVNINDKIKKEYKSLDNYLLKRFKLIPSVLNLFDNSIKERMNFLIHQDYENMPINEKVTINTEITKMFHSLDLKSISNSEWFKQFIIVEDEIANIKNHYNECVLKYNKKTKTILGKFIVKFFGFHSWQLFESDEKFEIPIENSRIAIKLEDEKPEESE